jgi:arylformamidase
MKVYDVSLVLRPDMPTWPGESGPTFTPLRRIAKGDGANVSVVTFGNHTGTHVDPPIHFIEGANTVDRLPIDALVGPCRVIGYDGEGHIGEGWLERHTPARGVERVLFRTRNSDLWRTGAPFAKDFVALDAGGARWLVEQGVKLVGIDYLSIEPFGSGPLGHPVHKALLAKEVVIVEGLDLSAVEEGDYDLVCAPLKLEGSDGSPARVFLIER